jgi:hypothetical protein
MARGTCELECVLQKIRDRGFKKLPVSVNHQFRITALDIELNPAMGRLHGSRSFVGPGRGRCGGHCRPSAHERAREYQLELAKYAVSRSGAVRVTWSHTLSTRLPGFARSSMNQRLCSLQHDIVAAVRRDEQSVMGSRRERT